MLIVQGQPVQNASKDYVLDDGQATQDWLLPAAMEALTDMLELDGGIGIPEESKSVIENACMMRWCLLGKAEKLRRRQAEQPSVLKQCIVDLGVGANQEGVYSGCKLRERIAFRTRSDHVRPLFQPCASGVSNGLGVDD